VHKLPPLRPTGSIIGEILPAVAARLGLASGTVVVAGTPDLHSAAVGAGAVAAYQPHLAISTTSWISCPYPKKKTDPFRQMATVVGVSPGLNLVANNQNAAGGALEWLRGCLAEGTGSPSYEQLTALAGQAEPGSGGVVFTPWLAGERSPVDNRRARAGFHNLSLRTSRPQLVRAVMEGVAFNSRWLSQGVERFVGRKFGAIRTVGGGALSPLWCAIYASVLGRPIEQVAHPRQANLRGSGLWAGVALGYVDLEEIRSLVPVEATYYPDPAWSAVYDRVFAEFPRLYGAHRGMFRRLNRLPPIG
jgi:xylulokinase